MLASEEQIGHERETSLNNGNQSKAMEIFKDLTISKYSFK